MTYIYILKLEKGRYYVGKSENVKNRFQQHIDGKGSSWTRKYRPMSIFKTIKSDSPFDEDKYTKEYMMKYGVDKVRGGSYVELELSNYQRELLNKEIWSAQDCCTRCGREGHFVKDCFAKTDVEGYDIYSEEEEDESDDDDSCFRCGRLGHYSSDCFASKHIDGYYL